jgi:diguanylate cyclase (GGDEF)-like protein
MQIRDSKPVAGVTQSRATERTRGPGPAGEARAVLDAGEVVTLSGIPEAEMTPRVRQALVSLMGEVHDLRRQLDEAKGRIAFLERLADEDALMPIANRRAFVRELSRAMAFAQRYGAPASVVYFDLDGLKRINDDHGHAAGDAALQHVARVLVDSVRTSDFVGRLGGDEFGVILVQTDSETAAKKAQSLSDAIRERPLLWREKEIQLGASWGLHSFSGDENAADAIDAADKAMYDQKRDRRGKNAP